MITETQQKETKGRNQMVGFNYQEEKKKLPRRPFPPNPTRYHDKFITTPFLPAAIRTKNTPISKNKPSVLFTSSSAFICFALFPGTGLKRMQQISAFLSTISNSQWRSGNLQQGAIDPGHQQTHSDWITNKTSSGGRRGRTIDNQNRHQAGATSSHLRCRRITSLQQTLFLCQTNNWRYK